MNISVRTHITRTDEVFVRLQESQIGKFATLEADGLAVFIHDREKLLEIASMLESAAQKWVEEE